MLLLLLFIVLLSGTCKWCSCERCTIQFVPGGVLLLLLCSVVLVLACRRMGYAQLMTDICKLCKCKQCAFVAVFVLQLCVQLLKFRLRRWHWENVNCVSVNRALPCCPGRQCAFVVVVSCSICAQSLTYAQAAVDGHLLILYLYSVHY